MSTIVTPALLLRAIPYGESDLIATLFTEAEGKLAAMVRGGRKSSKRMGGALEPFHTLEARLDDRGGDLAAMREARILKVRANLVGSLESIDAAGIALRWVRHVCPPRTKEVEAWATLVELLDAIDEMAAAPGAARIALATGGLRLLADVGYGLDLERCVRCEKECPPGRSSRVDPSQGGLICSTCGQGSVLLSAELRAKAIACTARTGDAGAMTLAEADVVLSLVDAAMAAHAGFDR